MLAEANANEWKDAIINKALVLNAYDILMGTETLVSIGRTKQWSLILILVNPGWLEISAVR